MHVTGETRKLGEILLEQGSVQPQHLEEALRIQQRAAAGGHRRMLGQILLSRGYVKRHHIDIALAKQGRK